MSLRTYKGREIGALLSQIRKEHGDDVHIIETRELNRNLVEIDISLAPVSPRITTRASHTSNFAVEIDSDYEEETSSNSLIESLAAVLENQGLSKKISKILLTHAEQMPNKSKSLVDVLDYSLSKILIVDTRLPFQKKFIAFVGPTGVGNAGALRVRRGCR